MSSEGVERLAEEFVRRRAELDLSQVQLAKRAGVSKYLVQSIERKEGRKLQATGKRRLERALGAALGSIDDTISTAAPLNLVTDQVPDSFDETFDPMTASNEELGRYADQLSEQAGDPIVGVRWMLGVQQKRLSVDNSQDSTEIDNPHAM